MDQVLEAVVEQLLVNPEKILEKDEILLENTKNALKYFYDTTSCFLAVPENSQDPYEKKETLESKEEGIETDDAFSLIPLGPFDELILEELVTEQIWEQVNLRNEEMLDFLENIVSLEGENDFNENSLMEYGEADGGSCSESDASLYSDVDSGPDESSPAEANINGSETEEEIFFKKQPEAKLPSESANNISDSEGDLSDRHLFDPVESDSDFSDEQFGEMPEDDSDEEVSEDFQDQNANDYSQEAVDPDPVSSKKYRAIGDMPPENTAINAKDILESDEESQSRQSGKLSSFEKEQLKLHKIISELESEAISSKPWQMKGEAEAKTRPMNSLLEEDLEFEQNVRSAPVITEQVTVTLEDKIKKRILEGLFDDVERKMPKSEAAYEPPNQELQMEKSKASLSELYENDFRQSKAKTAGNPKYEEISRLFKKVCTKLDAFSNFFYTPSRPKEEEISIVTNAPSISVEEVVPFQVSDASRLAPQEIYQAKKELKGETEKNKQDRKRDYREKKTMIKKAEKNLVKR